MQLWVCTEPLEESVQLGGQRCPRNRLINFMLNLLNLLDLLIVEINLRTFSSELNPVKESLSPSGYTMNVGKCSSS